MSFAVVGYFAFLLIGLVLYYVLPKKIRWIWLLALSYIYYFTFSIKTSIYMVFTTVVIYMGGIWLDKIITDSNAYITANKASMSKEEKKAYKDKTKKRKRQALLVVLLLCFGQLAVIKYTDFAIENINSIISLFGGQNMINLPKFALPLGISFFTFQSASYIIDVYQGKYRCQNNVFKLGLFVSFFPQLLQGPIGRYDRLSSQLYEGNSFELKNVQYGLQRICWGLAKKVILADRAAVLVNMVFEDYDMYGGLLNIVAVLMYSVQLYMDFSGGIDVVIGTAQMFGITMDENFRQPYFSKSIGEFWRRWHITLGSWFREYVYIPLGGNRKGQVRTIFNTFVVWALTGLWHGASWNFVLWGIIFFVLLTIEKSGFENILDRYKVLSHIYAMLIIPMSWIVFALENLSDIGLYFKRLFPIFGSSDVAFINTNDYKTALIQYGIFFLLAIVFSFEFPQKIYHKYKKTFVVNIVIIIIFWLSVYRIMTSASNPFLYFRF